jgi:hypothetical protein
VPQLRLVKGCTDRPVKEDVAGFKFHQENEVHFGRPPNLAIGIFTGLAGAAAGIFSLFVYFVLRDPLSYFSWDWLLFLIAGATAGFFLRLERLIVKDIKNLAE